MTDLFDDSRLAWGAVKPTSVKAVPIVNRTEFFSHWNGGPTGLKVTDPHSACLAMVKRFQAEHMADTPNHGWSDIGYNGLICPHARAIEGRGIYVAGAHCPDHNTSGIGFQFMIGKGEIARPAMLARMRRAYDECSLLAGRSLAKKGHRDGFATECPGDQIETWVKAGMPAPAQEDDMADYAAQLDRIEQLLTSLNSKEDDRYGVATGRYGDLVRRLVALDADPGVDSAALAKEVAAGLPADLAQRFASEFAKRLES